MTVATLRKVQALYRELSAGYEDKLGPEEKLLPPNAGQYSTGPGELPNSGLDRPINEPNPSRANPERFPKPLYDPPDNQSLPYEDPRHFDKPTPITPPKPPAFKHGGVEANVKGF